VIALTASKAAVCATAQARVAGWLDLRGESRLPVPPISGKAEGERPQLAVLDRR